MTGICAMSAGLIIRAMMLLVRIVVFMFLINVSKFFVDELGWRVEILLVKMPCAQRVDALGHVLTCKLGEDVEPDVAF